MLFAHKLIKHCDPIRMLKDSCASIHVKCRRIHPPMGVWVSAGPVSLSDLWWTSLCTPDAWRYDDRPDVGALLSHLPSAWTDHSASFSLLRLYALSSSLASFIMPDTATCWSDSCQTASVFTVIMCDLSCCYELKAHPRAGPYLFIRTYLVIYYLLQYIKKVLLFCDLVVVVLLC